MNSCLSDLYGLLWDDQTSEERKQGGYTLSKDEMKVSENEGLTDLGGVSDDDIGLSNKNGMTKLPFSHGIETELQIVTSKGHWIEGEEMKKIFSRMFSKAKKLLIKEIKHDLPSQLEGKITDLAIKKDKAGNEAVQVKYRFEGSERWYPIMGKDSHVTTTTNILEVQTPPCWYLEELEWWLRTVIKLSYSALKNDEKKLLMVSTGLNPVEGFSKGVTFGDHHHIGIKDQETRKAVYKMFRNHIPHLLALTVNSPLSEKEFIEIKKNKDDSLISPMSSLSLRVEKNKGQLACPPAFSDVDDKEEFLQEVSVKEDAERMIDVHPSTRFGTIEIRISDSQLSISDRLSLALLIQAMALKAERLKTKDETPEELPQKPLLHIRESTYKNGLLSPFSVNIYNVERPLEEYYPSLDAEKVGVELEKPLFMKDAVRALLSWLDEEIFEMGISNSTYLDPIFIRVFGPVMKSQVGPPITPAQFQLYLFKKCKQDTLKFLHHMDKINSKVSKKPYHNPIIDRLGVPKVPDNFIDIIDLDIESIKIHDKREDVKELLIGLKLTDLHKDVIEKDTTETTETTVTCRYLTDGNNTDESMVDLDLKDQEERNIKFRKRVDVQNDHFPKIAIIEVHRGGKRIATEILKLENE